LIVRSSLNKQTHENIVSNSNVGLGRTDFIPLPSYTMTRIVRACAQTSVDWELPVATAVLSTCCGDCSLRRPRATRTATSHFSHIDPRFQKTSTRSRSSSFSLGHPNMSSFLFARQSQPAAAQVSFPGSEMNLK
jgi:hypothetical protein